MQVKDVMTVKFTTVRQTESALVVPQLLAEYNRSMLPVLDHRDRLVGIVSRGDFLRYCLPSCVRFMDTMLYLEEASILGDIERVAREAVVADLMSTRLVTLSEEESICRAVSVLLGQNLNEVPVVRGGTVVGLMSRNDVIRLVARTVGGMTAPTC